MEENQPVERSESLKDEELAAIDHILSLPDASQRSAVRYLITRVMDGELPDHAVADAVKIQPGSSMDMRIPAISKLATILDGRNFSFNDQILVTMRLLEKDGHHRVTTRQITSALKGIKVWEKRNTASHLESLRDKDKKRRAALVVVVSSDSGGHYQYSLSNAGRAVVSRLIGK